MEYQSARKGRDARLQQRMEWLDFYWEEIGEVGRAGLCARWDAAFPEWEATPPVSPRPATAADKGNAYWQD